MDYQKIADAQAREADLRFKEELMAKIDHLTKAFEELNKKLESGKKTKE